MEKHDEEGSKEEEGDEEEERLEKEEEVRRRGAIILDKEEFYRDAVWVS